MVDGYLIQMATAFRPLLFELTAEDGFTPLLGAAPTCLLWKYGGAFGAPIGAVTEIGNGLYQVAPNATDCNTNGPLVLYVTCAGALPRKFSYQVVAFDPYSIANMGMTNLDAAITSRAVAGDAMTLAAASIAAATFAAGAIDNAAIAAGAITAAEAPNLDAAVSTRSSHTAADIWAVGVRTLTSYGTLVADVTTAVWGAGARTLTSFGTLVADMATAVWAAVVRTLTASADPTAAQVADAVWDEAAAGHVAAGSMGRALADILQVETGRWEIDKVANTLVFYAADGLTPLFTFDLVDNAAVSSRTPA